MKTPKMLVRFKLKHELNSSEFVVYTVLLSKAEFYESGTEQPVIVSRELLAELSDLSDRTILTVMKSLEKKGIVRVEDGSKYTGNTKITYILK